MREPFDIALDGGPQNVDVDECVPGFLALEAPVIALAGLVVGSHPWRISEPVGNACNRPAVAAGPPQVGFKSRADLRPPIKAEAPRAKATVCFISSLRCAATPSTSDMFFGLTAQEFGSLAPPLQIFLSLAHGFHNGVPIVRSSPQDKEYHFQNWVERRIGAAGLQFEKLGRHGYPDFVLSAHASGYEVKGLAVPGRTADFDCNSQLPLAVQEDRAVYYIFGRYPKSSNLEFPVHDLVLCAASLLNAETVNTNTNQSFRGAGSYGDILIRDGRMFVCPTPYALIPDTIGRATLILEGEPMVTPAPLRHTGTLERVEATEVITGYSFDFLSNRLTSRRAPNTTTERLHRFQAYRIGAYSDPESSAPHGEA